MKKRNVSVFDRDGTILEQVPYFKFRHAFYPYFYKVLKKRNDKVSIYKLAIFDRIVKNGDYVGKVYVEGLGAFFGRAYLRRDRSFYLGMKELVTI